MTGQSIKQTTPLVQDLMTKEVFTLYQEDNLRVLEQFMEWQNIRHIPVIDQEENLVGLVTHRDFLNIAISKLAGIPKHEAEAIYEQIPIGEIMNKDIEAVAPETTLRDAASLIVSHKYGCLPVVDDGKLVGIITEADFVRAFKDWNIHF